MSYKTRPYISGTFGIFGNPFIEYEIKGECLYTHREFLGLFKWQSMGTMPVPKGKTSADVLNTKESEKNFIHGLVGLGDVVVKTPSEERIFKNIRCTGQFLNAVKGSHPDVQSPAPPQPKWYEGLTDEDFEDFVIAIPQMPETVFDVLCGIADTVYPHIKFFKNNRECIRQGEPACRLNNIYSKRAKVLSSRGFSNRWCITAPVSGKIFNTHGALFCSWSRETGLPYSGSYRDCKIPISYFYIQPLKGQINKNATRDAYFNYIDMVKYAIQNNHDPDIRLPESPFNDSRKELVFEYIKLLEDCYTITIPIQIFYEYCGERP